MDLADSVLPRSERRRLERDSSIRTLAEIRDEIARFSPTKMLELLTDHPRTEPAFLVARLVRELASTPDGGSDVLHDADVRRLVAHLGNVFDPAIAKAVGRDLSEVGVTRVMAPQLAPQRDFGASWHRVLAVFVEPEPDSPLNEQAWRDLLGLSVHELLLGVWVLASVLARGPVDLDAYLAKDRVPEMERIVRAAVALLAGDLSRLRSSAGTPAKDDVDAIYPHGPILDVPIYRRADGSIAAPAAEYVRLAASPPALYVRLARSDGKSRRRTKLIGERLQAFLYKYVSAGAADGWQVRDLDAEPVPTGQIADIAIWPDDRSFLIVIEAKARLQTFEAMLGDPDAVTRVVGMYQKSFDQIQGTVDAAGTNDFLADAPKDVPVFGMTVTLDLHLTSVVDGRTFSGLVMSSYRSPTGPSAGHRRLAGSSPPMISNLSRISSRGPGPPNCSPRQTRERSEQSSATASATFSLNARRLTH